jgi:hypothetical protein
VENSLGIVELIQEYENPFEKNIETEYYFAISPRAALYSLEA